MNSTLPSAAPGTQMLASGDPWNIAGQQNLYPPSAPSFTTTSPQNPIATSQIARIQTVLATMQPLIQEQKDHLDSNVRLTAAIKELKRIVADLEQNLLVPRNENQPPKPEELQIKSNKVVASVRRWVSNNPWLFVSTTALAGLGFLFATRRLQLPSLSIQIHVPEALKVKLVGGGLYVEKTHSLSYYHNIK